MTKLSNLHNTLNNKITKSLKVPKQITLFEVNIKKIIFSNLAEMSNN